MDMDKLATARRLGLAALRILAQYAIFAILALICGLLFNYHSYNDRLDMEGAEGLFSWVNAIITVFIMNTIAKAFASKDRSDEAIELGDRGAKFGEVFRARGVIAENIAIPILWLIFPLPYAFDNLASRLFAGSTVGDFLQKLIFVTIASAIYILNNTTAHYDAAADFRHRLRRGEEPLEGRTPLRLLLHLLGAALLYPIGSMMAPSVCIMLISFASVVVNLGLIYIFAALVILGAIFSFIRNARHRRAFRHRLTRICGEIGAEVGNFKSFYSSIVINHGKPNFRIKIKDRTYSCLMLFTRRRWNNRFFGPEDTLSVFDARIGKFSIFKLNFNTPIIREDGATTIIIIDPEPNRMYVSDSSGVNPLRAGQWIYGYRVCTAEEFLGNVERGVLHHEG